MSSGYFSGARGRRKNLNPELNLVPFIDLFSTITIFLIATAVWDDLAQVNIQLGSDNKGGAVSMPVDAKKVESNVKITVGVDFIELFDDGKRTRLNRDEQFEEGFDMEQVDAFVANVREVLPEKKDMLIMSDDNAVYSALVGVMDQCLKYNFEELIVAGTSSAK